MSLQSRCSRIHALRALIVLALLATVLLRPIAAFADLDDTLDDGYVFTAAASGLIQSGPLALFISSDRDRINEDDVVNDPGDGTAGFIVVSEGQILLIDGEKTATAILNRGDASFIPEGSDFALQAIGDDARIWRISISTDEDDLPDDVDVTIDGGGNGVPDDAFRTLTFRTGIVPEGVTASINEGETAVLVYAISGDLIVDGDDVEEGDSDNFAGTTIESEDGPALAGFLAIGMPRTLDGVEGDTGPAPTATNTPASSGGGGGNSGGGGDNSSPPTETPTVTPTSTPEATATPTETPPPLDTDSDGLSDELEAQLGTDPNNPDSDLDGIPDGREVNALGTNPLDTDTDSDGLTDGLEVDHSCDANVPDTDGDGLGDAFEANSGFSECSLADTDGDGDDDLAEFSLGTDPRDPNCFSGPGAVCQ